MSIFYNLYNIILKTEFLKEQEIQSIFLDFRQVQIYFITHKWDGFNFTIPISQF